MAAGRYLILFLYLLNSDTSEAESGKTIYNDLADRHLKPGGTIDKVSLTQRNYIQFLKYMVDVPPITDYTFCIWMKSNNLTRNHPLLSYSKNEHDSLINAWITPYGKFIRLKIMDRPVFEVPLGITEHTWYHVCQSWAGLTGQWDLFTPSPNFPEVRQQQDYKSPALLIFSLWMFSSIFSATKIEFTSNVTVLKRRKLYQPFIAGISIAFNTQDVVLIAFASWMLNRGLASRNIAVVFPWVIFYGLYYNHYTSISRMAAVLRHIRYVTAVPWLAVLAISIGLVVRLQGVTIPPHGDLVVGQEYTDFDKGLDDGIEGDIFGFNMVLASTTTHYTSPEYHHIPPPGNLKLPVPLVIDSKSPSKAHFGHEKHKAYRYKSGVPFKHTINLQSSRSSQESSVFDYEYFSSLPTRMAKTFFDMFDILQPQRKITKIYRPHPPIHRKSFRAHPRRTSINEIQGEGQKPLGLVLVEMGYDCVYRKGAPLDGESVLVSWTKTAVRVFGGAALSPISPFCV
nr:unnamed protein product [Callosobruchus chinensis]